MFLWQFTLVYSANHASSNSDWGAANIFREKATDLSKIRERVQISALGHAHADQSGADFFRSCLHLVLIETESATSQTYSSGQLTEVINSWLISVSVYQRIVMSVTPRYWQCWATFMSTKAKREWISFHCTNRLGKTNCLSPYCILSL